MESLLCKCEYLFLLWFCVVGLILDSACVLQFTRSHVHEQQSLLVLSAVRMYAVYVLLVRVWTMHVSTVHWLLQLNLMCMSNNLC